MISEYRLKGLSAPKSGTLELIHSDKEIFWAPFDMPKDRFQALFKWAKSDDIFWKAFWIAKVSHEAFSEDGLPIGNLRIIEVYERKL